MGASARHGPHHVAQKSTRTGVSDFKTSWSKFASVTSTIPLPAMFVSPRCNVALSADAPSSARSRFGDLGISAPQSSGQPIIVSPLFDAWGVAEVAKTPWPEKGPPRRQRAASLYLPARRRAQLPPLKTKKRPRLFSQGRLGSPPPELPNHRMDTKELLILCKRHFGNGNRSSAGTAFKRNCW